MTPPRTRSDTPVTILVVAALGIAALVVAPLAGLLARVPWTGISRLAEPEARTALIVSLEVSSGAALLAVVVGFPIAWVLARTAFVGRSVLRALVLLPLVLPPVVGGVALLTAFGRRGIVGRFLASAGITLPFTTAGAVLAAAFVSTPLVILAIESGLRSSDSRLEDAAATMGASRGYVIRRITIPLLRPQLLAAAVLAWARALGEFGATITFAGNLRGRTQTLPLAVFETLQSDPDGAFVLSVVLMILSLGVLIVLRDRFLPR
ncbi:ABC transporter permease [soil metagenome]